MEQDFKEDLRIVRTRTLLCKSFFELLEKMPYDKISVIDICNNAMVHRATFYNHFDDKEHLLEYAIDEVKENLFNATIENEKFNTPKEMYMSLISKTIDFILENKEQFLLIIKKNSKEKIMGLLLTTTQRSISYLVSKNEYKEKYILPTNVLVDFIAGGITNLGLSWIQSPKPCTKEQLMIYCDLLLNEKIYTKPE